ncbi:inverse autotransporter beta domain-containing protein [Hoeflea sp. G2-23]|uniref:Inverse autotransporter beta domain-containing protein n=1 Tax=Hoeflea algicola TaxID=2983763 RepID=A0ABT3ZC24_9HYPH|nr:inverse autotransporter beta domain-containing protein [Hoeflea algicola]MCY0149349.1 inverse autotransporter beta domain-containing protein [Hoeflea algicola]
MQNEPSFDTAATDQNTQTLQRTFDALQAVGNAANSGNADEESLRQACGFLEQQSTLALQGIMNDRFKNSSLLSGYAGTRIESLALAQGQSALAGSLSSTCAALTGMGSGDITSGIDPLRLKDMALGLAFNEGVGLLKSSGLPFTGRLEISGDLMSRGASGWEVLTVQPLWQDPTGQDHIFTQLSLNHTEGREGYAEGDTLNAGLAYRHLSDDRSTVYGLNAFWDHTFERNHNRMSIGADVQTSELGASVNRYIPLSSWKGIDDYTEERASWGWDLQLQGRVPSLPSWQANVTGFQWSSNQKMEDKKTYGYDVGVQWQPVNAFVWDAGVRNEQDASPQFHTQFRLVYKFNEPIETMWNRRVQLTDVSERVYDKVRRENAVRVTQRTKESAYVTVQQTIGANTATLASGAVQSLQTGQQLPRPFTVQVSAAGGSVARLVFRDGAVLTIGAGSTVRVESTLITLLSGTLQYVSGAGTVNLAAPGSTVTLLGTDVDLSTNGTTSTLRVRDGGAVIAGTNAGSTTLNPGEAAAAVSGVVGASLATNNATYITHTDNISAQIDRVAAPLTGGKVAPYASEAPRMTTTTTTTGQTIGLALKFNSPVTVGTGGGTPQLVLNINGNTRQATYNVGTGTDELSFTYVLQGGDAGTNLLTVQSLDLNGGTITGNGKNAVITIADKVLNMAGGSDIAAPIGYVVAFTTDPVTAANVSAAAFQITGAEVGATYNYTISSSGGGTNVTGTGTITTATQDITGIDLVGLGDGTLTVSLTLTDTNSNIGAAVTDTVTKNAVALALDFVNGAYALNGTSYGSFAAIPGASFTRANPATTYAEDSSGNLVAFAANEPRITDKGLLVEGSRTNLLARSEEFDDGVWLKSNTLIFANSAVAPDGTTTADKVVWSSASGAQHSVNRANNPVSVTNGRTYVYSVWLKAAEMTTAMVFFTNMLPTNNYVTVDLSNGTITSGTATIQNHGNGWYRVTSTGLANNTTTVPLVWPNGTGTGAGDETSGLYIWGAQLEEASFASSYIPTAGAPVTRDADGVLVDLGAWFNTVEGTVLAEGISVANGGGSQILLGLGDGSFNSMSIRQTSGASLYFMGRESGSPAFDTGNTGISLNVLNKVAGNYKEGMPRSFSVNGDINTGGVFGAGFADDYLRFGIGQFPETSPNGLWNGYIQKTEYHPIAVSNAQLQSLTAP